MFSVLRIVSMLAILYVLGNTGLRNGNVSSNDLWIMGIALVAGAYGVFGDRKFDDIPR